MGFINMFTIYHWIFLGGFAICLISCLSQFFKVILSGLPKDFSQPLGKTLPAIVYSFTGAMSPTKKETAYLHLPTYSAGIIFHIGTFCGIFCLIVLFFNIQLLEWLKLSFAILLIVSAICGLSILIKRISVSKLRNLSNPDDYISNVLVTGFHILLTITILNNRILPVLLIYSTVLFLYLPIGKLRHTIYFFTSRIHLGFFYGWRGVWPIRKHNI
jgi:hypothetical protein